MKAALRSPVATDYAAIASWVPDAVACARWAGLRVSFPFTAEELPELLSMPGGEGYCLASPASPPCGFGQHWMETDGRVHLGRIIVAPCARGQGVGRELCRQLIVRAIQAAGAATVTLRVYRDNPRAFGLYSSLGFTPVESESDEDVLFMRMQANPFMERYQL